MSIDNLSVANTVKLSDFVLNHSYFKYDGDHYKQIFGCTMGSLEETAISTFPAHPPQVVVLLCS